MAQSGHVPGALELAREPGCAQVGCPRGERWQSARRSQVICEPKTSRQALPLLGAGVGENLGKLRAGP